MLRSLALVLVCNMATSSVAAFEMRPVLSRAVAVAAVDACRSFAEERGWKLAITVVDDAGQLVAFERMDGAFAKAEHISRLKADTAAMTPFSTAELREMVYTNPDVPHGVQHVPGVVVFEGGEQILTGDGMRVGAIGVSGSSSANDGMCARAALAAIAER